MATTKEEVQKAMHNHMGVVRNIAATMDYTLTALVAGYKPEVTDEISGLKSMMDNLESIAAEAKSLLDEWPT